MTAGFISREDWQREQRAIWYGALGLRAAMLGIDIGSMNKAELIIFELPETQHATA